MSKYSHYILGAILYTRCPQYVWVIPPWFRKWRNLDWIFDFLIPIIIWEWIATEQWQGIMPRFSNRVRNLKVMIQCVFMKQRPLMEKCPYIFWNVISFSVKKLTKMILTLSSKSARTEIFLYRKCRKVFDLSPRP